MFSEEFQMVRSLSRSILRLSAVLILIPGSPSLAVAAEELLTSELIFPLETWHNHGSCIVECPNGDLLACWFHGSGERRADDVVILGARKRRGTGRWSAPFLMADVPDFPDTNCCMIIDQQQRLWLLWPTILANTWESALMHYRISTDYMKPEGPPEWDICQLLLARPGNDFQERVAEKVDAYLASQEIPETLQPLAEQWKRHVLEQAGDKLTRRLGWFTRAHPLLLNDDTLIVGLYSDGFSFSLAAITRDGGETWQFSEPIVGGGNIQPSFAVGRDGRIVAYMRDNGPPPKRIMVSESRDQGMTWSTVYDHPQLPNPGSGLELAALADGDWICIYNDTEQGRHSLAVSLSSDEGATWTVTRHLERTESGKGSFHYPSIVQGRDGTLHATWSYFVPTTDGERKSIKYVHFTKDWITASDSDRHGADGS